MENASKALIIAGAILLSILLISLGIMIFNQAQTTVQDSGMSQAEISTFNSKFTKYEGKIKGSQLKSLIQDINTNNSQDESSEHQVTISGTGISSPQGKTNQYLTKDIVNTKTYTVTIDNYEKNGRVSTITVQ